jgi:hypothetical protein
LEAEKSQNIALARKNDPRHNVICEKMGSRLRFGLLPLHYCRGSDFIRSDCAALPNADQDRRLRFSIIALRFIPVFVFLLPDCWFLFYAHARHRVTRLTVY